MTSGILRSALLSPILLGGALVCAAVFSLTSVSAAAPVAQGQVIERIEAKPERLKAIDVVEQLGATLPADLDVITAEGASVRLGELLISERPLLLTFNYSSCPMLCSLQLNGLVEGLQKIDQQIGRDFAVLTISLDPEEDPARLQAMKDRYLAQYLGSAKADVARAEATRKGWQFVRSSQPNIKALAALAGFSYDYNEEREEYIHPAAVALLTPGARIARYLYGIEYHPRTLSLSLVEVSEGKIGGSMEKLLLYCFHYDETEGRYAPMAMNIMRLGGGTAALALGSVLAGFWLRESRKNRLLVSI